MVLGPEYTQVEKQLLGQLTGMGWAHVEGAPPEAFVPTDPTASGRTSFSEVFLTERLRNQINVLNLGPGGDPWLTPKRLDRAFNALARIGMPSLLEANQQGTELLLNGITVEGLPAWDGGRDQRVNYIDWEYPERNDFVVVSQFRLDIPGTQGKKFIVPDEVLFVNGIPLALVECKKPGTSEAMAEAIRQHLRYADRRGSIAPEGNPKLFHTMQLLVATCRDRAMLGSITSNPEHYAPWRRPVSADEGRAGAAAEETPVGGQPAGHPDWRRPAPVPAAGHRAQLRDVHADRRGQDGQGGAAIPAVPRGMPGGRTAADGQDQKGRRASGPARRDHLAHSGVRQEPHDDVPGPQDAGHVRPADDQGRRGDRPDPASRPAQRDDGAVRGEGRHREEGQAGHVDAESARPRHRIRHDPEAAGRGDPKAQGRQ